ncbi:MAG: DUF378 domain-containing protein [Clostridiales bacterium]|jgi:uncharacterized membrane protein YuzA (DUF378 family)|nr:DUF378 domain-containing protein [Clostridiales bacterium]
MRSRPFDWTALTLVIIGAINWGLIGFFKFDLIATLFGGMEGWLSRIIYAAIGLAGLYSLSLFGKMNQESFTGREHYSDAIRSE